jgi:hypothetical protein
VLVATVVGAVFVMLVVWSRDLLCDAPKPTKVPAWSSYAVRAVEAAGGNEDASRSTTKRDQITKRPANWTAPKDARFSDICPNEHLFAPHMLRHFAFWPDNYISREVLDGTYKNATANWIDIRMQIIDGEVYYNWHPKGWHYSTRNPSQLALYRQLVDRFKDIPDARLPDIDFMWQTADVCHFIKVSIPATLMVISNAETEIVVCIACRLEQTASKRRGIGSGLFLACATPHKPKLPQCRTSGFFDGKCLQLA